MKVTRFISGLAEYSSPLVFNPYRDNCEDADLPEAPAIRRENLAQVLSACVRMRVDTMWVARDLGYRGGRRTGIALTDEARLSTLSSLFNIPIQRATRGVPVAERTAGVVWQIICGFEKPVFLWNVFPFHPHEEANPFTNRCHTRAERQACAPILLELLDILRPKALIAIGNDAQAGLRDLGIEASPVRHPSYGGTSEFIGGLSRLYGVPAPVRPQGNLSL